MDVVSLSARIKEMWLDHFAVEVEMVVFGYH